MELSIYLKNHNLKVVIQDSKIVKKNKMLISKVEYEELLDSKLNIENELQSLTAHSNALKESIESFEMRDKNRDMEERWQKEQALKLLENLSEKIFDS